MSSPTINPAELVTGATGAVVSGVQDNLSTLAEVAGGLIGLGVVWRLVQKFTGKKA